VSGGVPSAGLAVEVGGTSIRAAAVGPQGDLVQPVARADTPNHLDGRDHDDLQETVLAAMQHLAAGVLDGAGPDSVCVAYPGPIDATGHVLATPTVLGAPKRPFALGDACRRLWPAARMATVNDVTAAGYRYAADGARDFAVVTVGSGIGHKLFMDGRPRVGDGARGGEIGHLRLDYSPDAPQCECGGRGHLGGLASGRAVLAEARSRAARDPAAFGRSALSGTCDPPAIDGPALASAFLGGDEFATGVVSDATRYLGQALAALHLDSGVERIILVGGFALALGEPYRQLVARACAAACWDLGQDWDAMVETGELDAGLRGAGLVAAGVVQVG
jgi:C7-cyclitol 7-kinase